MTFHVKANFPKWIGCPDDSEEAAHVWREEMGPQILGSMAARGWISEAAAQARFEDSAEPQTAAGKSAFAKIREFPIAKSNLYIFGPCGSGKTHAARCLLTRRLIEAGLRKPLWVGDGIERRRALMDDVIAEVSALAVGRMMWRFSDDERKSFERLQRVGLLLLDDVDKLPADARCIDPVRELMDSRYDSNKRTIFTANMPGQAWADYVKRNSGENVSRARALLDRMRPCEQIELPGESWRAREIDGSSMRAERRRKVQEGLG